MELAGYFPYLPNDGSMSEEERSYHLSTLYQESEKIKARFASMMQNLQKNLEKNSKLEHAIKLLTFYDSDFQKELCDCTNFSLLFQKITDFVSFYDYELLKFLAKYLGSREIKKRFNKYKLHFRKFAKRHIYECRSDLFSEEAAEKPGKIYAIKISTSIEKSSLKNIKKLLHKMNEILNFAKVVKIEDDCIHVAFSALSNSDFIISDKQQRALSSLGVVTISCGSESVNIPQNTGMSQYYYRECSGIHHTILEPLNVRHPEISASLSPH